MYITSREKEIIQLIIKTAGKHTAFSIANDLKVSSRTIQRDLKSVEKILHTFDLRLMRNIDKGLLIEGKNEQVYRLIQFLMEQSPIDQTIEERKLQILLVLLHADSYKTQSLAFEIGVSITTLAGYLDELAEWLTLYQIQMSRKRGIGIELSGTEINKRKALANYFLIHFKEELIEQLFLLTSNQHTQDKVLQYFRADYLQAIDQSLMIALNHRGIRLADSGHIHFVIHTQIAIQRTEDGFQLAEKTTPFEGLAHEYEIVEDLFEELKKLSALSLSTSDLNYLAIILKGSKLQTIGELPYDRVELTRLIKHLIQYVSTQLHVDLTQDFSLYQGLLAHMEPSIFRMKEKNYFFNPLKEEIKQKYPLLFMAIKNFFKQELVEIEHVPDDELAFIVLHFGSALEMIKEDFTLKALVICPTGIGTSKMLANRIKKEFTEIDSVDILSIKDMQSSKVIDQYHLIISTVKLPFIDMDYMIVSPLLSEENIITIRSYLQNNIEKLTSHQSYIQSYTRESAPKQGSLITTLQNLKDVYECIDALRRNFRLYRMKSANYQENIKEMIQKAEADFLLTNTEDVLDSIKNREEKGGLGIPNTTMGLFHCRNPYVTEPIFQISHLPEPCLIKGMDGKEMRMTSLLLLLTPNELSEKEQEIVSLISTSLIEDEGAIIVYSSSNEEMIRKRLEKLFLNYLHTNLLKE